MLQPVAGCLVVALQILLLAALEYGYIEVLGVEPQHIHQVFPCHVDGALLEVVAEAPVAEHFEHGVVVGVVPHFLQVVVLAAHAQALLRVGTPAGLRVPEAQDNILPLVHARIGKHQCGVVLDYHRCRGHYLVSFRLEVFLERVADFICCHCHIFVVFLLFFQKIFAKVDCFAYFCKEKGYKRHF